MSLGSVANQGLRFAGKYFVGIPVAGAVGLGALPHLGKITQAVAGLGQPGVDPTATPPASTANTPAPGTQAPPSQASTVDQNAALLALLERLAGQSADLSQAELNQRSELYDRILDPGLYGERAAIDLANYERQAELSRQAGMEQTRELTRRKIESDTINAWKGITEAQIDANAKIGLGMMNLAYAAGVPNPNVLTGGAALAGQGRAGFGTPTSVIN